MIWQHDNNKEQILIKTGVFIIILSSYVTLELWFLSGRLGSLAASNLCEYPLDTGFYDHQAVCMPRININFRCIAIYR